VLRKVLEITIPTEGRDRGKVFQLKEADAIKADKWAMRAFLALNRAGVEIPDEIAKMGIVGILAVGVHKLRGIAWEDLEPLVDEMMACVKIIPTPSSPNVVRNLVADDIEEISTLALLRREILRLHLDFTLPADTSKSQDEAAAGATS
jgi:hypothetical protein